MDQLLPRYEPNTDAFADRAALVLQGSAGLTCARSGWPLDLGSTAQRSPRSSPSRCASRSPRSPSVSARWPSHSLRVSYLCLSPSGSVTSLLCHAVQIPFSFESRLPSLHAVQLKSSTLRDPCGSLQAALSRCSSNRFWHD